MATGTKEKKSAPKAEKKPSRNKSTKGLDPPAPDPSTVKAEPAPAPPPVPAQKAKTPIPVFDARKLRMAANDIKNIAEPIRLTIMLILDASPTNVGDICRALDQSQPAVSHHLALLRHARLIEAVRAGKNNIYELTATGDVMAKFAKQFMG